MSAINSKPTFCCEPVDGAPCLLQVGHEGDHQSILTEVEYDDETDVLDDEDGDEDEDDEDV